MKCDVKIREDVIRQLQWDAQVPDPNAIGVAVKDGAVTLTGHVTKYAQKLAAAHAAERVHGVEAVADELTVYLPGERDDEDIARTIAHVLTSNVRIPDGKVHAEIKNRWVTLEGEVDQPHQRFDVERVTTEVALDRGRRLLDSMPYPENLDNHFVVDPTKFDFYAMDCYRLLTDDKMAENLAHEVIQASTDFDGKERAPMRLAEAHVTLGVVAARQGDPEEAIHQGKRALNGERKSLPSLLMASRDLTMVLNDRYPNDTGTKEYLDQLHVLSESLRRPSLYHASTH